MSLFCMSSSRGIFRTQTTLWKYYVSSSCFGFWIKRRWCRRLTIEISLWHVGGTSCFAARPGGDTGRFALSLQEISVVQGESIIQAVPQIADIILTYHNSNLVIARRLPSYASPVASYRFICARILIICDGKMRATTFTSSLCEYIR